MKIVLIYLFIVNAAALLVMLVDKLSAKKNLWRIPERTLIGLAAIGGSVGMLFGMYAFRHKTRHLKFFLGIPLILAMQIVLAIWILR